MHLVLSGLNGLILGWACFPSILVGLALQAILFQYGGITTLGVNTFNIALPALLAHFLFRPMVRSRSPKMVWLGGFGVGATAIGLGALLIGVSLAAAGEGFREAAGVTVAAHLPVMVAEGVLTGFCVSFIHKVKPELLGVKP